MPTVKFLPAGVEIQVKTGESVLDAALDNDIDLNHNCGGNCVCSTCHVIIEKGSETLEKMSEDEEDMLDEADGRTSNSRLACQTIISADLVVTIPDSDGP